MGFFSKLKQNFNHGGVKIVLQVPSNVESTESAVAATVTLTAGETQAQINKVWVEIDATKDNTYNQQNNTPGQFNNNERMTQTIGRAESTEIFTLMPGETRTIQLSVMINLSATLASMVPQGSALAGVANVFQKLETVTSALGQDTYTYHVTAKADVDGVTLDPSHTQLINIHRPGQIGGNFSIGI